MNFLENFKQDTRRGLLFNIGGIFVAGFLLMVLFFYVYLPLATAHNKKQQVPDLRGLKEAQVADLLEDQDLRYEIVDSTYAADQPPLAVVTQNPSPKEDVKANRKIYLTINQVNPPSVNIPNLIDASAKNAREQLTRIGLVLGEIKSVPWCYDGVVVGLEVNGKFLGKGTLAKGYSVKVGQVVSLFVGDGEMEQTECRGKDFSPH